MCAAGNARRRRSASCRRRCMLVFARRADCRAAGVRAADRLSRPWCWSQRSRRSLRGAAQWEAGGLAYAALSGLSLAYAARRRPCRADRHPVPVRGGLGDRHLGLFRRPRGRRAEAGAVDFAGQDRSGALGGTVGGVARRRGDRGVAGWRGDLAVAGAGRACCCRSSRRPATCSNPGSSGATASRIPASSFPAMAASWIGSTGLSRPPSRST